MHQFRTLVLCASSLLLLSIAVPAGKAHAQTAEAVSPWLWGTASIKVSECKDRADKFLEAKGLVVTKVTSQGSANTTNANDVKQGVGGHLACFEKHRVTFERVADIKHQRGVREESGAVIVQGGDLKTFI